MPNISTKNGCEKDQGCIEDVVRDSEATPETLNDNQNSQNIIEVGCFYHRSYLL